MLLYMLYLLHFMTFNVVSFIKFVKIFKNFFFEDIVVDLFKVGQDFVEFIIKLTLI